MSKPSLGQQFFRVKADFVFKEKSAQDSSYLTIGKVYFDANRKNLVYKISFPEKEIWFETDSAVVKTANGKIIHQDAIKSLVDFSIFNLVLNGHLNNYGLNDELFQLSDVEKADSMVISTYVVNNPKVKKFIGEVLIATKNKKLFGVIFNDASGNVVSKRFFEDYQDFNGVQFPTTITQIYYIDGKENDVVQQYKNIQLNETDENDMYNFSLSTGH